MHNTLHDARAGFRPVTGTAGKDHPINADADIVPGVGLGGIALGTPIAAFENAILCYLIKHLTDSSWYGIQIPFQAWYSLGPVQLRCDVRIGAITELVALPGYAGALFGNVRPGMKVSEAMRLYGADLTYDEGPELLRFKG